MGTGYWGLGIGYWVLGFIRISTYKLFAPPASPASPAPPAPPAPCSLLPAPCSLLPAPCSPCSYMVTLTLLETEKKTPLKEWCFKSASLIRIGRSGDNDIVVNDSLVSRHHLEIRKISSGHNDVTWRVISLGTNGTFLNGTLLAGETVLPDNALLQLAKGGPIIKFQVEQAETQSQEALTSRHTCSHEGNAPNNLFCIRCGQPILVKQTIRQYQVLKILGQGGMGTTYLAWDGTGRITGSPQLLVLKQMNADMAKIAKAQELFEREAYALKLLSHPGIPRYYDFFVEGGKKYLAMELVHGQDLEKLIYLKGPVTPNDAIAWMIQTCDILDYLHSQNPPLIHRDIKPANLMVRNTDDHIFVLDFGAVKEIGTTPGTRIGADGYCAPEQERGQPLTQSDLYAIAPTLIFLLTGEHPIKYYRQQGRNFRFDVSSIPTITPQLREVIDRATKSLPRERYQTAQELATALAECRT